MSARRAYRDDPELIGHRPDLGTSGLGLFDAAHHFPTRPVAGDEQLVTPISGTIQAAYQAWRGTTEGDLVFRAFCREAVNQVASGATRLSGKGIAEAIRLRLRREINNSHIALMVRDCELAHPVTARFEKRTRKAS